MADPTIVLAPPRARAPRSRLRRLMAAYSAQQASVAGTEREDVEDLEGMEDIVVTAGSDRGSRGWW
jgi:hypothetical protein